METDMKKKLLSALFLVVMNMLVFPFLIFSCAPSQWAMGLYLLLLFVADPFVILLLGVLAGTKIRLLW